MSMQSIVQLTLSRIASGAVAEYRGVGYDGAQATVQGQKVMGFAHYAAAAGDSFDVDCAGTVLAEAGAAIAVGDSLIVDAQGRVIPGSGEIAVAAGATAVTSTAANGAILTGSDMPEYVIADAIEAAGAAGEIIEILMRR